MIPIGQDRGIRTFVTVWAGQIASLIGSGLTSFALGVWIYQTTQSATLFALLNACAILPHVVVSPFAGALADRHDRRMIMLLSDTGAALCTILLLLAQLTGLLDLWVIYLLVLLSSCCSAFQYPAYSASITQLVPKEQFGRASGMVQFADAASRVIAPILAGTLIVFIGLHGIFLLDLLSFGIATSALLLVRFPPLPTGQAARPPFLPSALYGWRYIVSRPGLRALLIFFAIANISLGMVQGLLTPLVLSFASPELLGLVVGLGSAGLVLGTVLLSVWGGPKRRIHGVLGLGMVFGLCIMLIGLQASAIFIGAACFLYFLCQPLINGSNMVIWRLKVPADVQGRVFAALRMIAWSTTPLTYLIAGPLADHVFNPLLLPGGALAPSVGQIIGVGAGRGIGLILLIVGTFPILAGIIGYTYPPLRDVEDAVPDAVPQSVPA